MPANTKLEHVNQKNYSGVVILLRHYEYFLAVLGDVLLHWYCVLGWQGHLHLFGFLAIVMGVGWCSTYL